MSTPGLELFWIPLGAGQRVVRVSGTTYEAVAAAAAVLLRRLQPQSLYHDWKGS